MLMQTFPLALQSLAANRLRSALTTLGIVLGVGAVVCMVAVGDGARSQISEKIAKLGTNLFFIESFSNTAPLTEDDAATMLRNVQGIEIATPIIWGKVEVVARNRHLTTTVWGNDSGYLLARDWPITAGRLFDSDEIASGEKVAIIGQLIADKLFDGEACIGRTVRIDNVPFTIIGVLKRKGQNGSGANEDDIIVIPLRSARSRVLGEQLEAAADADSDSDSDSDSDPDTEEVVRVGKKPVQRLSYAHQANYQALDYLAVKYSEAASAQQVRQAMDDLLRSRHHIAEGTPDNFGIFDPADVLSTQEAAAKSFSWLLAAIASISLVVGGITIMNTMLVSVAERTREIGLRMAVGARRRDIGRQFLIEAMLLALCGALAGTVLGVLGAVLISRYGGWPVLIRSTVVLLACGVTSLVGIVFGLLPAIRASRLDPMVALRTE